MVRLTRYFAEFWVRLTILYLCYKYYKFIKTRLEFPIQEQTSTVIYSTVFRGN